MAGFVVLFRALGYPFSMSDTEEKLTPANPSDLADAIAFALRSSGRKRVHNGDEFMAKIAAKRIVRHLELARFVVMRGPPIGGSAPTRAWRSQ